MAPIPGSSRDDPDKEGDVSSVDAPQFAVHNDSSGSDVDEDEQGDGSVYAGYQPLPQEPCAEVEDTALQEEEEATGGTEAMLDSLIVRSLNTQDFAQATVPQQDTEEDTAKTLPVEVAERNELWSHSKPPAQNIKIDSEKAEKIRAAMVGFKLPSSHVPDWAKLIPEEQWKTNLMHKLSKEPPNLPESPQSEEKKDCSASEPAPVKDSDT